ncbi:glycoside hydrolase family 97 catalytic domain-containing protein [Actinacidiphila acidipaludis]|uniref:Glycoside hydrolase family 97 catalytic domain-containing protein n=1 Tax=Actinacidiphila acidipaludis TaxID=2873382 RepID=A0ABS7QGI9_9ACTN|nr:glycoside hydrolase family 97 catalytic domain-containing protein [Streptomyces acidipaludis]MBY8882290.1 glycoside hydrolase family 97 catalytic domain-containing protein [Streptomyces acidipaludis]
MRQRWQRARRAVAGLAVAAMAGGGLTVAAAGPSAAEQDTAHTWTVAGPGGSDLSAELDLDAAGELRLAVDRGGAPVLLPGRLGIRTSLHDLTSGLRLVDRHDRTVHESYRMTTGKQLQRSATMREATLTFAGADGARLGVVVRVSDDGVAYRYVLDDTGPVTVEQEASTFEVPTDAKAWVQPYQPSYETERTETTAGGANAAQPRTCTGDVCSFGYPTLFDVGGTYVLLTEADVDGRYSGSHLDHRDGSSSYQVALADNAPVTAPGPLATPWRTAIVGSLDTLVGSTLVDDLAPPSKIKDTSWIRPGIDDWSWLSDGSSPGNFDRQKDFVDYAAAHGLPYTLVDAGWQASWVPELVRYARARGVDVLLWFDWNDLRTQAQRDSWLPKVKAWGVAGVKVDYMYSDAQSTFQWYDAILRDTAQLKLMIDFHGATIPRGLQRTWPQVMSVEGVRGEENGQNPTRDIFLAFTRNIVGSMDYTPTWFSRPGRQDTAARELALPVVFESGWTSLGDKPEGFATQPVAEDYLEQLPTTWDETRLVSGAPGQQPAGDRQVVMARRNGDRWFVGGILAGAGDTMNAPLSFLGKGPWLLQTVEDAASGGGLQRTVRTVTSADTLSVLAQANGGFAAIACPAVKGRTDCDDPVVTAPATTLTVDPASATAAPGAGVTVGAQFRLPQGDALHQVHMTVDRGRLPAGWTVTGHDVSAGTLPAGRVLSGHWTVTVGKDQPGGTVEVPVWTEYANPAGQGAPPVHVEEVVRVSIPLHGNVYASDQPFLTETNGWGPVERDRSNGETGAQDGNPLTVDGTVYAKGLGMNADARVDIDIQGRCTRFQASVGVDDEVGGKGSVNFTVLGDGHQLAASDVVRGGQPAVGLTADVTGVHTLSLVVGDGGDDKNFDHADWGGARLTCLD